LPLFAAHAPAVGLNRAAFDNPQRHVNRFETELHLLGGDAERLRKTVLRLEPVKIARNVDLATAAWRCRGSAVRLRAFFFSSSRCTSSSTSLRYPRR
jgi:hypothetical protein